jgi:hypothetical protein
MAYYPDLSPYEYGHIETPAPAKLLNFGWLECGKHFDTAPPEKWLIDKLWAHCLFAVSDYRGYHPCDLPKCNWKGWYEHEVYGAPVVGIGDLCDAERAGKSPLPEFATLADYQKARAKIVGKVRYKSLITATYRRHKERLGFSEIRIFGQNNIIYAAPNQVFHYVTVHHYKMPDEVIDALKRGPCPPEQEWFDRLRPTGVTLDMMQCYQRARRARCVRGRRGIFDIPTGPVKWIPGMAACMPGAQPVVASPKRVPPHIPSSRKEVLAANWLCRWRRIRRQKASALPIMTPRH